MALSLTCGDVVSRRDGAGRGTTVGTWSPLPEALEPEMRHLAVELRAAKDASGLSLAALARKTSCSTSAWSRYFNARVLPPRELVAALAALVGLPAADQARLLALWELAEAARSRRDGTAPPEPAGPADVVRAVRSEPEQPTPVELSPNRPSPPRARTRRRLPKRSLAAAAGAAVLVAGGLTAATTLAPSVPWSSPSPKARRTVPPSASLVPSACGRRDCETQTAAATGCDRDAVTTTAIQVDYAFLQVRYSAACKTAWAQLTGGHRYDQLQFTAGRGTPAVKGKIRAGTSAATPMLTVPGPGTGLGCAHLTNGARQCTPAHPQSPSGTPGS